MMAESKTIVLAGGCFWGTQKYLSLIPGVLDTQVGYANSVVEAPSYEQVCTSATNAAEAVRVSYDPKVLSLRDLLDLFFEVIDPIAVNQQGNDVGTQYRTGIYYGSGSASSVIAGSEEAAAQQSSTQDDLTTITTALAQLQQRYAVALAIEVGPLSNFYPAEDYHQDYLDKNPGGYCHIDPHAFVTVTRKAQLLEHIRQLTPLQYAVTQQSATEPPFTGAYDQCFEPGIYVDVITGTPLFASSDKFESGCGWPAFARPLAPDLLTEVSDHTLARERTEVRSADSDAHLGHVFNDGPQEQGGLRYCINSAALRFVPLAKMEAEGYGAWLNMVGVYPAVSMRMEIPPIVRAASSKGIIPSR